MVLTKLTLDQLAQMIDHTFLKAYAQEQDLKRLCDEAKAIHFRMVAINSVQTAYCREQLKNTDIHVGAAISFPLGQTTIKAKISESTDAIQNGADEIDYVINISKLKDKKLAYIEKEMQAMVDLCHANKVLVKVILETCYLDKVDIINACRIAKKIQPDFVKTSTGFGSAGATVTNVRLMKATVGDHVKVKAAGAIETLQDAISMIEAGAQRIGTSHGVEIINQFKKTQQNN